MSEHCLGCRIHAPKETSCPGLPSPAMLAVVEAAAIMRGVLRPIFDYVPLTDRMRSDVWTAMKTYDDALAAFVAPSAQETS